MLNGIDLNGKTIDNVGDPSTAQQAATKAYVDAQITARAAMTDVVVLTTANVNLAAPGATIDGQTVPTGGRFAAAGQTTGSQNGVYVYNGAAAAATRAPDADTMAKLSGSVFAVQKGTNADKLYLITNDDTDTLGTTTVNIVQTASGGTYTADGQGIELVGSQFQIELDTNSGLSKSATGLKVDPNIVARKFSASCVVTTNPQTFTHNLGTKDVIVQVRRNSDDVMCDADIIATDVNNVSVNFGGAPTAGQYRVTVIG